MPIRKAVFPVAGMGTRLLPATKSQPKEMLPVGYKPVVQYVVEEMVEQGLSKFLFITGRKKRSIEDHFDADPELEALLESLRHCTMPYTCPHGRPTLIEMSYPELEKKFGRTV